ncbi:MAG: hypothetical protein Q7R68_05025, partial [Nitrospirales bacterium]|nr:hypothetical protein [Nitrospirales bacterium]
RSLSYLHRIGQDMAIRVDIAGFTPEQVIAEFCHQARAYYLYFWASCSKDEQFILYHAARDGFINWNNCEIHSLLERRILVKDPALRFMSQSFKRFVLSECCRPEYVKAWRKELESSVWKRMEIPLLMSALGIGAFLYMTQQDFFKSTMALATGIAAGVPAIIKFFGALGRAKSGTTEEAN